jgi:hypothetical protein
MSYDKEKFAETNEEVKVLSTEERERILLAQLLNNEKIFIKGIAYLKKEFFESKINKLIIDFMKKYYDKYKSIPSEDIILVELDLSEKYYDWLSVKKPWIDEYLEDYLNSFIRNMSMKMAIEESIELLEKEDYGLIEKKIKDAVNVDLDTNIGVTIEPDRESFEKIFEMLTSKELTIPTGWENVDEIIDGGVTIPSLNYLLAKSGGGKSIGLINLAWNYVKQGRDVVYISLELKEEKIIKRFMVHSTKIPTYKLGESKAEIYNHIKNYQKKEYGRFTVQFYHPNTLNAMKLELYVKNYIQKYNRTPILVVDYAGLMIPNVKNWNGLFEKDKYVSEELRGVAILFNTVIWTADQYNRCIALNEEIETPKGKMPIKNVKVGDKILGLNNEWRNVLAVTKPEKQEVYEIKLKSGKSIKVSARHLFPKIVNGKIVEDNILSSLKVGDKLIVKKE